MKKESLLAVLVVLLGLTGVLYAVTTQPIANGPSILSKTQTVVVAPSYSGQLIVCSNCAAVNAGLGTLCISTGTATGAWIIAGSSLTATTVCK